jgi:hypothetical protein
MRKLVVFALVSMLVLPAQASRANEEAQLPPMSYTAATFHHPNGCVYSRADPPGYPRTWHVIMNAPRFFAGAKTGSNCTPLLYQPRG